MSGLGSNREELSPSICFPLCPQTRTLLDAFGMSQRCQQRTHAVQQKGSLFDHLVGERKQIGGNGKTERFGSLEIEYEKKSRRLFDRQVSCFFTLENLIDERRCTPPH